MLFNSFEFVALVLVSLFVYYLPFVRKVQVPVLIAASLFFYGYTNPALLILFLVSVVINVTTSYLVVHGLPARRRLYATLGVVINLLILAFFKYSPLVGRTFFPPGHSVGEFLTYVPLPIGISFFTFEGISLVVDAYKGRDIPAYRSLVAKSVVKHTINTTFFVAFFPHLVAGPILKAHDFIPQIREKFFTEIDWTYCYKALVTGYFLKMVIADQLNHHTFWIQYPYFETHSSFVLLTLLFGYSIQIFADFAGYSLIAIGVAGLFGYRLMQNFNYPYISTSFSEFWRRWHISLSTFLKEYLYIPLGGNRKGPYRTYFNLMLTMVLGGLWHGAAWSYAVWGTFHGLALALERFWRDRHPAPKNPSLVYQIGSGFVVFFFVTFAWLLFKLTDFNHVIQYIQAIFNNTGMSSYMAIVVYVALYTFPVVLYHFYYLFKMQYPTHRLSQTFEPYLYGFMFFMIVTNSGIGTDFIYFQF
ncbi:MBOAT family O-acyltransferase [Arundinibacter roseus]|uniref:MBOAT family protein n=1 Tax=Arundinibacter roseus TaxID=2070510 RepID=A0A4R4KF87_9BACT|nr:MBOAT family O-acyltransferase [Arundinibacter roseus]TDB65261.1 MBOAT family protein [Arundinibacter roseus]